MNVLYVEDSALDSELVRHTLARRAPHIRLDIVATMADALQHLNRFELAHGSAVSESLGALLADNVPRYDLVLTDLSLPDGSGLDILAEVRKRNLKLAVVILTGSGQEESVFSALQAGANDYLNKRGEYLDGLPNTLESALKSFQTESALRTRVLRVLYAEPNIADADLTVREFSQHAPHIHLDLVHSAGEVLERLSMLTGTGWNAEEDKGFSHGIDVLLLDYRLPGMTALDLVKELRQIKGMDLPIVLITGHGNAEIARLAINLGVHDYLIKAPHYLDRLPLVLESAYYRVANAREHIALIRSEREFHSLADNLPDVIARFDANKRHLYINPVIETLTGKSVAAYLGRTNTEVGVSPDRAAAWDAAIQRTFDREQNQKVEFNFSGPQGTLIFESLLVPERSTDGKVVSVLVIARNITERWLAEQALRFSEQQLQLVTENFPGDLSRTDKAGRFLFVNTAFARRFGYAKEQIIGRMVPEIVYPEILAKVHPLVMRALAGERVIEEVDFVSRTGEKTTGLSSFIPEFADDGTVSGILQSQIDITELKKMVAALRERDQQLSVISLAFPGLISRLDRDLRIVFTNLKDEVLYRSAWRDVVGLTISERSGAERFSRVEQYFQKALQGESVNYENTHPDEFGRDSHWLVNLIPDRAADQTVQGVFVFATDITQRRLAELALYEREQELSVITDQFPGTIARLDHEMRFRYINEELVRVFNRPREEIIGHTLAELIGTESFTALEPEYRLALAGESRSLNRTMIDQRTGEQRLGILNLVPDRAADGSVQGLFVIVMDVTNLRRAEQAARVQEQHWKTISDNFPGLLSRMDRNFRVDFANANHQDETGIAADVTIGRTMPDMLGPDRWSEVEDSFQRALRGERMMYETTQQDSSGNTKNWVVTLIPDHAGEPVGQDVAQGVQGLFLCAWNVTPIRQAELSLRERERELSVITDQFPGTIARIDKAFRFRYVNEQLVRALNLPREEIIGQSVAQLLGAEAFATLEPEYRLTLAGQNRSLNRSVWHQGVGAEHHTILKLVPDTATDGSVQGLFAISVDVTDLKRAEWAASEQQRHWMTVAQNFPGVISRLDREFRVLFSNGQHEIEYGLSSEQAIGMVVPETLGEEQWSRVEPYFRRALLGERVAYESSDPNRLGEMGHWIVTLIPDFAEDHTVQGLFVCALNITDRKKAELELQLREQHLALIADVFPGAISIFDRALRFRYTNRRFAGWFNQTPEQFIGRPLADVIGIEQFEPIQHHYERALAGERINYEVVRPALEGRPKNVGLVTLMPEIIEGGQVNGVVSIWLDITDRWLAEQALAEREQMLTVVTNQFPGLMARMDQDLRFMFVNGRHEQEYGMTTGQIIGKTVSELIGAERFAEIEPYYRRALAGERVSYENVPVYRTGTVAYWVVDLLPDFAPDQTVRGLFVSGIDITQRKLGELALVNSEARLAGLIDAAMDATVAINEQQNIILFNRAAEKLFGWTGPELMGQPMEVLLPKRYRANHGKLVLGFGKSKVANQRMSSRDIWGLRKDGTEFPLDAAIAQMETNEGHIYTVIMRDITERKLQEKKIQRLSRMQEMHSAISSAVVRIHERQALLSEVCRIVVEQINLGMAWVALNDEATNELWAAAWWGSFESKILENYRVPIYGTYGGTQGAAVRAIRDGKTLVVNDIVLDSHKGYLRQEAIKHKFQSVIGLPLIINKKAIGALVLYANETDYFDVEEVKLLEDLTLDISVGLEYLAKAEHINYLAYNDKLTGLPNRVRLLEQLEQKAQTIPKASPIIVALVDIARFRLINDSFGRDFGDDVVKLVASRLRGAGLNPENCARLESNCFAVLFTELDGEPVETQMIQMLEDILQRIFGSPFRLGGKEFHLKAKCGAAIVRSGNKVNGELAFRQAELALQNAKKSVENVVLYRHTMDERSADALNLEMRLRRALDLEEFVLFYQPKINVADQTINSVEALIRWQDPEQGLVPPGLFIPILEKTGMIFEVGQWVLRQAAKDFKRWRLAGMPAPRIAVNVSALQLGHHDFISQLKSVVKEKAGADHGLDIEITESVIMDNLDENIVKLNAVRELGMDISIDDFGTGYSSLSYLSKLPVNTLKVDRSFVIEMTTGEQGRLMVASIITLAHTLKLKVVAEGVETQEQMDLLVALDCDQIQGYLISKPLPVADLENFLVKQANHLVAN